MSARDVFVLGLHPWITFWMHTAHCKKCWLSFRDSDVKIQALQLQLSKYTYHWITAAHCTTPIGASLCLLGLGNLCIHCFIGVVADFTQGHLKQAFPHHPHHASLCSLRQIREGKQSQSWICPVEPPLRLPGIQHGWYCQEAIVKEIQLFQVK